MKALFFIIMLNANLSFAFNCKKAETPTEKAICKSKSLLEADSALNATYKIKSKSIADDSKAITDLKKTQKEWLTQTHKKCVADEKCILQEYTTRTNELKITAKAVESVFKFKAIQTKKKEPIDLSLEYPEFSGNDKKMDILLNQAIAKIWDNDKGCDTPDESFKDIPGDYHRELTVSFATNQVLSLNDFAEYFCPGNPHPDNYNKSYLIDLTTGNSVDFWEKLTAEGKKKLIKIISAHGLKNTEDCKDVYTIEALSTERSFNITLSKENVSIEPILEHVLAPCTDAVTMPRQEFKKYFTNDKNALKLIDSVN